MRQLNDNVLELAPGSSLKLYRAGVQDTETVFRLLRGSAEWMQRQGIRQWRPEQFTIDNVRDYMNGREVIVAADGAEAAGMFTLQKSDPEYWGSRNDERFLYLHKLSLSDAYRGSGLGSRLISWAEEYAGAEGYAGLRLDTVSHNVKLNRYYQGLGFRFMGIHRVEEGKLVNLYQKDKEIGSSRLLLKFFAEPDFPFLQQLAGSPVFLKQWAGPSLHYPLEREELLNYLEGANYTPTSDKLLFTAALRDSGEPVGHVSLHGIDRENGSARIGRVVLQEGYRGRGLGLELIKEVLRIGFAALGLHRLSLGVFDFNTSAAKTYECAGFIREGVQREAARFGDTYADCIEMSILDREWLAAEKEGPRA